MSEVIVTQVNFDDVLPAYAENIDRAYAYWANKTVPEFMAEMPDPTDIAISDDRTVRLLDLTPADYDDSETVVLGLPFLNGFAPHQLVRAKTLQMLLGPEVPVVVMPNNDRKHSAYSFTKNQLERLRLGSAAPLGEVQLEALEGLHLRRPLGAVSITGYSQGGTTALAMGAKGSTLLDIRHINGDEVTSKTGRDIKGLKKDFMSGGMFDVPNEAKEADIDVLNKVMNKPRFLLDIARFGIRMTDSESKLIQGVLAGSVDRMVGRAAQNGVGIHLGYIHNSPMFDPASISPDHDNVSISRYVSELLKHGHATGDHPMKHGLLALLGLARAGRR